MSWRESPIPQRPAVPAPAAAVRARPAPRRRRSSPKSSRQLGALLETIPVAWESVGRFFCANIPGPGPGRGATSAAIVSIHSVFLFVISAFFCFDRTQRYPRRRGGASARSRFVFGTIRLFQLPPPTSRASRPPTQSSGETSADPPRARPRARQVPPSGRGRPAARFPGSASRAESYFPVQRGQ